MSSPLLNMIFLVCSGLSPKKLIQIGLFYELKIFVSSKLILEN